MRRHNLRLSVLSLSTLVIAVIYNTKTSNAWDTSAFGSMGDVDWSKRWDTSAYTSMGDVDWTKRNGVGSARQFGDDDGSLKDKRARGLYRTWLSKVNKPAYQYHSMADTDWGWKKRAALTDEDDHEQPSGMYHNYLMKKARGYKHRPYYGYNTRNYVSSRYRTSPYTSAVRSRNIKRPRQYNYHSMADMDWGWKRKKRTGQDLEQSDNEIISEEELDDLLGLLYQNSVENEAALDESKRNIASVRNHGLDKKSVAALARNNNFVDHEEKRDSVDINQAIRTPSDSNDPMEEKRNIASVASDFYESAKDRHGRLRRGGLSSLARNGYIKSKIMRPYKSQY
jgi:hypothetical protein